MKLVTMLKALSDENKLRIMNILQFGELCVCEIEYVLDLTQSNASRHLEKLKNAELICGMKKAPWVYYRLNEDTLNEHAFLRNLMESEFEGIDKFQRDIEKLQTHKAACTLCSDSEIAKKCSCK